MPRNPNKRPCQVPSCRSWAMRGHTRCRAHRDAELGPRHGGAPRHNLNALRTGRDAHPLPPGERTHLVGQLISDPEQLPLHLQPVIASMHARTGDPFKTLVALRAALAELLPLLAQALFATEFEELLHRLPPDQRSVFATTALRHASSFPPEAGLNFLRALAARLSDHLLPEDPFGLPRPASAAPTPPASDPTSPPAPPPTPQPHPSTSR